MYIMLREKLVLLSSSTLSTEIGKYSISNVKVDLERPTVKSKSAYFLIQTQTAAVPVRLLLLEQLSVNSKHIR